MIAYLLGSTFADLMSSHLIIEGAALPTGESLFVRSMRSTSGHGIGADNRPCAPLRLHPLRDHVGVLAFNGTQARIHIYDVFVVVDIELERVCLLIVRMTETKP